MASIVSYSVGPYSWLLPGFLFGLFVCGSLALIRVLTSIRRAIVLIAVTTISYPLSILVTGVIQLVLSQHSSMRDRPDISGIALFAGGFVGAFLVIGVILLLIPLQTGKRSVLVRSLCWPLLGGILGVIGWDLGASLGISLWSIAHHLHLTANGEARLNALHGDTSHQFSLWLVWQTGMAVVLALAARKFVHSGEIKQP